MGCILINTLHDQLCHVEQPVIVKYPGAMNMSTSRHASKKDKIGNKKAQLGQMACCKWPTCITPERWQPTEQDVQHNPQAPHVRLVGVVLLENLWGDVVRTANNMPKPLPWLKVGAQPKVSCFDDGLFTLVSQQKVLWLDVSVHDSCRPALGWDM